MIRRRPRLSRGLAHVATILCLVLLARSLFFGLELRFSGAADGPLWKAASGMFGVFDRYSKQARTLEFRGYRSGAPADAFEVIPWEPYFPLRFPTAYCQVAFCDVADGDGRRWKLLESLSNFLQARYNEAHPASKITRIEVHGVIWPKGPDGFLQHFAKRKSKRVYPRGGQ